MDGSTDIERGVGACEVASVRPPRRPQGAAGLHGGAEDSFLAAFDEGVARLSRALVEAALHQERWLDRIHAGLLALLRFLDEDPECARLLVLDALSAGSDVLERRQRALGALIEVVDGGRREATAGGQRSNARPRLMAEGIVGAVFAVIHARTLEGDREPLEELAPSLMSMIVLPYLGQAAASAELARRPTAAGRSGEAASRAAQLPIRATQRTTLVLRAVGSMPRSSNREIAAVAGLGDEGQASRLLSRLERRGLIENVGLGQARGEPNAWLLTPYGQRVAELSGYSLAPAAALARTGRKVKEAA